MRDFKKVNKDAREKETEGRGLTATDQSNSCKKKLNRGRVWTGFRNSILKR